MEKLRNRNYAQIILLCYLALIGLAILIKEIVLVLFALIGLLVYKYREPINERLKKLLEQYSK